MPNRRELASIHIAKKELKLDDDTYRGVLWDRYGKESAADLSERQVADLIEHFRRKGWRPSTYRQTGLMHVLWRRLAEAGAVEQPGGKSLSVFIEHATGKEDPRKLTVFEASHVIEMLKKWLERVEEGRDRRH